jgi:UDP-N-acetylglucosamine 3-dehydrogenase
MEKLKVAVIGVGFWGRNHARIYSTMDNAELVAVVDSNVFSAETLAKRLECSHYSTTEELLEKEKIDAVSVCTPSSTHAEVASRLIERGVSLLVEKPLTATLEEGLTLFEKIKKHKVLATVGFIERFNPAVQTIKQWIENGRLGKVILFYSKRVSNWPERIGDVGVVKDLSIHDLDLARHLLKDEPSSVYAIVGKARNRTYEDFANILLSFQNSTAFVESNWLTPYKERLLVVTGSEATATVNYLTQEVSISDVDGRFSPLAKIREPLQLELESFVKSILNNQQPLPSVEEGLKALALAEAAALSSQTGSPVKPNLKF